MPRTIKDPIKQDKFKDAVKRNRVPLIIGLIVFVIALIFYNIKFGEITNLNSLNGVSYIGIAIGILDIWNERWFSNWLKTNQNSVTYRQMRDLDMTWKLSADLDYLMDAVFISVIINLIAACFPWFDILAALGMAILVGTTYQSLVLWHVSSVIKKMRLKEHNKALAQRQNNNK